MCGGWFFSGMPFMWLGGSLGIFSLVIIAVLGAFWLGSRTKKDK